MKKLTKVLQALEMIKNALFGTNTRVILSSWVAIVFTIALFMSFAHKRYELVEFFGIMLGSVTGVYTASRTIGKTIINKKENNETNEK